VTGDAAEVTREVPVLSVVRARLVRARVATGLVFLSFGTVVGAWTSRVPAIKAGLGLTDLRCPAFLGQWIQSFHSDERPGCESS